MSACLAKHRSMESRGEGCTLTSCGHIPASKVSHGGDAGEFCDFIGIADLQGKGIFAIGLVTDCLTMTTDGADIVTTDARFLNDLQCRLGKGSRHHLVEMSHAHQFVSARYG